VLKTTSSRVVCYHDTFELFSASACKKQ